MNVNLYRPAVLQTANKSLKAIYIWGLFKSPFIFPGLSQDLREAFASFRAWGFTTVGDNGFSLGLGAFKDSCSCPGTSCVL